MGSVGSFLCGNLGLTEKSLHNLIAGFGIFNINGDVMNYKKISSYCPQLEEVKRVHFSEHLPDFMVIYFQNGEWISRGFRNLINSEGRGVKCKGMIFDDEKKYVYIGNINNWKPNGDGILFTFHTFGVNGDQATMTSYESNFEEGKLNTKNGTIELTSLDFSMQKILVPKKNMRLHSVKAQNNMIVKAKLEIGEESYEISNLQYKYNLPDQVEDFNAIIKFSNNFCYTGSFKIKGSQLVMEGKGELQMTQRRRYKGGFLNNRFDGEGEFFYSNGDKYVGNFSKGLRHGSGEYYYKKGSPRHEFDVLDCRNWNQGMPEGPAKLNQQHEIDFSNRDDFNNPPKSIITTSTISDIGGS